MSDNMLEKSNFSHVKRLGNYRLLYPLGIGGMGEVYLAEREPDRTKVAIKLLLPSLANNRYHIELFLKEIKMLARIKHPGIVRALDAGVQGDVCFFVMDYIQGRNLVSVIEEDQPVSEVAALVIIRDAAVILRDVYRKYRIIHRDIKPENIMITPRGSVHVLDFGLSWGIQDARGHNSAGVGTAHFAAPEQQAGKEIDYRADIYALGATLFQVLTGRYPYERDSVEALREAHQNAPVPNPRELRPNLSDETTAILLKCLAKAPEDRYVSWREMIHSLNHALRRLKRRKYQSRRRFFFLIPLLLFSGAAAGHFYSRYHNRLETQPTLPLQLSQDETPDYDKRLAEELRRLREYTLPLLERKEFAKARELWLEQLKNGEFKDDEEFIDEANRFLSTMDSPEAPKPPRQNSTPRLQGDIGLVGR